MDIQTQDCAEQTRKNEEMYFHNQREKDRQEMSEEEFLKKYANKKFYKITRKSMNYFEKWLETHCKNKVVLDYCCGLGENTLRAAKYATKVISIDISSESIETAKKLLQESGYADKVEFHVMDAENLQFETNIADVAICAGVLHHLDVKKAYAELARVLKPEGAIICLEALGYNPVINLYRQLTPHLRTAWEKDHILTLKEINYAKKYFSSVNKKYFYLFSLGAIPFHKLLCFKPMLALLEWIDNIVLKVPFINLMAWQVVFELSKPKTTE